MTEATLKFFYTKWSICKKISTNSRTSLGWTPGFPLTFYKKINSLGIPILGVLFRHGICSWGRMSKVLLER